MAHLIDKDAILAEIEKRIEEGIDYGCSKEIINELKSLYSSVSTLEVKEVELKKEIDDAFLENKCNITDNVSLAEFVRIAKYFFELGLKVQKEPVSEDLGEYINELSKQFPEVSFAKLSRIAVRVAKWQNQQDQSTIELAEDHAMLAGMEKMKEEMMKDATDVTVHVDAGGYPYIPQMELYDYDKDVPLAKVGDRYKVILIKEE